MSNRVADHIRPSLAGLALLGTLIVVGGGAGAAQPDQPLIVPGAEYAPGEVIVRYPPGVGGAVRNRIEEIVGAETERRLLLERTELLNLDRGTSVGHAVAELNADPRVLYAEPNYIGELALAPDDTEFGQLWGMRNTGVFPDATATSDADIDATEAWDIQTGNDGGTGNDGTIVAVVDSGVDLSHPDLTDNRWYNRREFSFGDSVDNDGNGLVDDIHGWDFLDDFGGVNPHGTHVAGTIAAQGNNSRGVAGVSWDADIMDLRVCGNLSGCYADAAIDAYVYARDHGARVVNSSFGVAKSQAVTDTLNASPGVLFVFAAGNGNRNLDADAYPCDLLNANVICVGASTPQDTRAGFSNWGAHIDLFAPGTSTLSTTSWTSVASGEFLVKDTDPFTTGWTRGGQNSNWGFVASGTEGDDNDQALTDSPGGSYPDSTSNFVQSSPISTGDARGGCAMAVSAKWDMGPIADSGDHDHVNIAASSSANGPWTNVQTFVGKDEDPDRHVDMTSAIGVVPNIHLRFVLNSNASGTADGFELDAFKMWCFDDDYSSFGGTSMAAPHVSGAAALLFSEDPRLTPGAVRSLILDNVDTPPGLNGLSFSNGRLNIDRAMDRLDVDTYISSGSPSPTNPTNDTTPTFEFSSSADPDATFECRFDGSAANYDPCSGPVQEHTPATPLSPGRHEFEVRATAHGNTDGSPARQAFDIETVAPNVTIDSGPTGPTQDSQPEFTFHADEPDADIGACRIDGGDVIGCKQRFSPDEPLPDGPHTFTVTVFDDAGNSGSASRSFSVDASGPVLAVKGPTVPTNDTTPTFEFAADEPGSFECRVEPAAFGACSGATSHTTGELPDGPYRFQVRGTDGLGNVGAVASEFFEIDTVAPTTQIVGGPGGETGDSTPEFTIKTNEDPDHFICQVDAEDPTRCLTQADPGDPMPRRAAPIDLAAAKRGLKRYRYTLEPLNPGQHRFRIRAVDLADNRDATVAGREFVVLPTEDDGTGTGDLSGGTGAGSPGSGSLPFTGLAVGLLAIIGGAMALSGGALQRLRRGRRDG